MEKIRRNFVATVLFAVIVILMSFALAADKRTAPSPVSLSADEQRLFELITDYRRQLGLPDVPLSPSLTKVAQLHVRDLEAHPPQGACNMHSWSAYGDWSPCCYLDDHSQMDGAQLKPGELTVYTGRGYENAHWNSNGATAQSAFNGWKNSPGHHATMVNQGIWSDRPWKAIGVGIYGKYAVAWFGHEDDPAGIVVINDGSIRGTETQPQTSGWVETRRVPQRYEEHAQSNLRLTHTATKQQGGELWNVRIHVAGSASDLDRIQRVDYTLHPTFDPNQQSIADRGSNFTLSLNCWGQFTIKALVVYHSGQTESLERYLSFNQN